MCGWRGGGILFFLRRAPKRAASVLRRASRKNKNALPPLNSPVNDMTATVAFCPAPSRSNPTNWIVRVVTNGR
jgi:hypothetical protein